MGAGAPGAPWAAPAPQAAAAATAEVRIGMRVAREPHGPVLSFGDVIERLASVSSVDDVAAVAELVPAVLAADEAAISRVVPGEGCIEDISRHGWSKPGARYYLRDYPATEFVLRTRTAGQIVSGDPASDPAEVALLEQSGFQALLMVPLFFGGRDVGLLELYRRHAVPWSGREIERANLLAHQLGAVIDLLARTVGLTPGTPGEPPLLVDGDPRRRAARVPRRGLPFTSWCHMATDGDLAELHAFAARLGLRRAWFQRDHYDLPPHGRAAAVALGAVEVSAGELLLRMAGPRGDRARRRVLAPAGGVAWLRGAGGPAVLRYPAGALVVIGGPPGAGKSTLAARVVDAERVPVLDPDAAARRRRRAVGGGARALARGAGRGAAGGQRSGRGDDGAAPRAPARAGQGRRGGGRSGAPARARRRRGRLPRGPRRPGRAAHLRRPLRAPAERVGGVPANAGDRADPAPFASVTVASRAAADRLRRVGDRTSSAEESRRGDSNPWPLAYKASALPTELLRRALTSLGRAPARRYRRVRKRAHPTTPVWVKLTALAVLARRAAGGSSTGATAGATSAG